ncbi:hypothetical protein [Salegentibacter chungangensis]|uniref:Uncharacterized protein n=1 Tax=Salegentibacter chungangensis TaxID=1335724 RepID=A0ABW3NLA1_9FLAO
MDTSSLIMGVILLMLFFTPVLYLIFNQSATERKSLKKLKNIESEFKLKLQHKELSNSLVLGLDPESKKLVVAEPQKDMEYDIIDLSKVRDCTVSRNYTGGRSEKEMTTRVGLELLSRNGQEKITEILFYDEDDEHSYDPENKLFLAKKWDSLIREHIPKTN